MFGYPAELATLIVFFAGKVSPNLPYDWRNWTDSDDGSDGNFKGFQSIQKLMTSAGQTRAEGCT